MTYLSKMHCAALGETHACTTVYLRAVFISYESEKGNTGYGDQEAVMWTAGSFYRASQY